MVLEGRGAPRSDGRLAGRSDGRIRGGSLGLLPNAVAGLWGWWGWDSASYDGSGNLVGVADKGSNGIDLVPDSGTGPVATTYAVNGVPTDLPGPFTVANPTNHPESVSGLAKVFTDITVMAVVPTITSQTTGSAMCGLYGDDGGGSTFQLVLGQGATPGSIEAFMVGGALQIPVGWSTGNDGSFAIVFFRREAGVDLVMDSWYDRLDGSGTQKPAQAAYGSDPTTGSMTIDRVAWGGRGSLTQVWAANPVGELAIWERALSYDEVVGLAQGAAEVVGMSGVA